MIRYIKLTDDSWVKVDIENNSAVVLVKSELIQQKAFMEEQLAQIPEAPTDEEYLEWAKANHPYMVDSQKSKSLLETEINSINSHLESMI